MAAEGGRLVFRSARSYGHWSALVDGECGPALRRMLPHVAVGDTVVVELRIPRARRATGRGWARRCS